MTHKKVNNADAGTADIFGGNDLDKWSDFASGVDVDDYDINSDITFRSAKRYLRNPANTFSYQEIASAIVANRTVTEPLLIGNDTRVYQNHIQSLIGKTISFDTNTLPEAYPGYTFTVYRTGGTTKCRNNQLGTVVSSSATNPEIPIQYALDNGLRQHIYIAEGSYNLLAGVEFTQRETSVVCGPGTLLTVPTGFTGNAIKFPHTAIGCHWRGGKIAEAATQSRLWNCFYFEGGASGCFFNTISNVFIRYPNRGFYLKTLGSGGAHWLHSIIVNDSFCENMVIGAEIDQFTGSAGINKCSFNNLFIQSTDGVTTNGFKNIAGEGHRYHNCVVWDIDNISTTSTANITSGGINIGIDGGKMTQWNFTDLGFDTYINDETVGLKLPGSLMGTNRGLLSPAAQNWGIMSGLGAHGDGVLGSQTNAGTVSTINTYADGAPATRYTTAGAALDNAGTRIGSMTFRGWNPYMEIKFRVNDATNDTRAWFGWSSTAAEMTGDDALNGIAGVMVGFRATDTANFMRINNDGTGATNYTSLGVAKNQGIHTAKIIAVESVPKFVIVFDTTTVTLTTEIPAQQTALFPHWHIESVGATAKTWDRFYIDVKPRNSYNAI